MSASNHAQSPSPSTSGTSPKKSGTATPVRGSAIFWSPLGYKTKNQVPISLLKEVFEYDAECGCIRWLIAPERKPSLKGKRAGYQGSGQYRWIKLRYAGDEFRFSEHQAVWALLTDVWPTEIDHINGHRQDNRIENLREVTRSMNLRNAKKRCDNTSGVVGVNWDKRAGKWHASIRAGYSKSLGYYSDFDDAVAARKAAEVEYGYHENHGRN